MIITYDGAAMADIKAACENANNEIAHTLQLLMAVKSHNDWNCKEKSAIDGQMAYLQNQIRAMSEDTAAFLEAIAAVQMDLDNTENEISNMFRSVEELISRIISIPVVSSVVNGVGSIISQIISTGQDASDVDIAVSDGDANSISEALKEIVDPIPITEWQNVVRNISALTIE